MAASVALGEGGGGALLTHPTAHRRTETVRQRAKLLAHMNKSLRASLSIAQGMKPVDMLTAIQGPVQSVLDELQRLDLGDLAAKLREVRLRCSGPPSRTRNA